MNFKSFIKLYISISFNEFIFQSSKIGLVVETDVAGDDAVVKTYRCRSNKIYNTELTMTKI